MIDSFALNIFSVLSYSAATNWVIINRVICISHAPAIAGVTFAFKGNHVSAKKRAHSDSWPTRVAFLGSGWAI